MSKTGQGLAANCASICLPIAAACWVASSTVSPGLAFGPPGTPGRWWPICVIHALKSTPGRWRTRFRIASPLAGKCFSAKGTPETFAPKSCCSGRG